MPAAGAAPRDVRLVAADPSAVRFVVEVPEIRLDPVASEEAIHAVAIDGYAGVGRPGSAALPERVVVVAVPPAGAVAVSATGSATEVRDGVRLAAVPIVPRGATVDPAPFEVTSPSAGPGARGPVARLLGVSWMRHQRIARVAIAPARFEPGTRRLAVDHRIEVEVRVVPVPGGATRAGESVDSFEDIYRQTLVNYEQGRSWRRPAGTPAGARGAAAGRAFADPLAQASLVPDTSLYAGRRWIKIAIPRTGFYRVDFGQVRNSAVFAGDTTTALDSLRLFTWPGVPVLPENTYCDSCDYREVAIGFVENGNGLFSNNRDYFYFFALGASDWADLYDPNLPETTFVNHPYETRNYVYLARAEAAQPIPGPPRRIPLQSGAFTPADTSTLPSPSTFAARSHFEQDIGTEFFPDSSPFGYDSLGEFVHFNVAWERFFWGSVTRTSGAFEEGFDLPGLDVAQPARLRARVWGLSQLFAGQTKTRGLADHKLDASLRVGPLTVDLEHREWDGLGPQTYDTTIAGLAATGNAVRFAVTPDDDPDPRFRPRTDNVGVAWFDVFYRRFFTPVNDELVFDSDPAGGTWIYKIGPFAAAQVPRVFDVTDPLMPVEVLDPDYRALSATSWELRFKATESGRRRYRVVRDASTGGLPKPSNSDVFDAPSSSLQNLRGQPRVGGTQLGTPLTVRYLLVYYDGFRAAADTLLRWRQEHLPLAGVAAPYDTFSVPISALYDQFSGGRTDPSAIRNFLRAAFYNWGAAPTFVTILGDASRDFKNLSGQAPAGQPSSLIPTYEGGYDDQVLRQYSTDDWMLNVTDPAEVIPDFIGARIPAGDAASAMTYVRDKLLPYERSAPLGEWRDRVMLIADDDVQGGRPDPLGWLHLSQTARLDDQGLAAEVDRAYVYLHTYPLESGSTRPKARLDLLRNLADGVVIFNYIGHGSPIQIADEKVFSAVDATGLTNRTRLSIFVAASCDVGKFDNPNVISLGELLTFNPSGGTVAVVSATEVAFSSQNAALNLQLLQALFERDAGSGRYERPVAEALKIAKVTGVTNNQKYQMMGDAAVRPVLPRLWVEASLQDLNGAPVTALHRGETLELVGRVLDRPGGSVVGFDGLARVLVEDSAPVDTAPECVFDCGYRFRAAALFRGDMAVSGGQFRTRFVVPMDAHTGPRGRARGYVEMTGGTVVLDGAGSVAFPLDPGTAPLGDNEGPRIALSFVSGSNSVRPDAVLKVDLFDPSGILITGHVPQNGIVVTIDEQSTQRYEITSTFRYAANSYQGGTATFRLPRLAPGPHRIRVSAADNLAAGIAAADHRSSATIDFEVTDSPVLKVTRSLLFPNPVRSGGLGGGGQFVVDAPGDSVNVLLRIYSVAGRAIRTLEFRGGRAQVQIPWDGLDAEGAPLAQGTYLYKVQVYARDARGGSSDRQRAEAEGRFVVVGH